MVSAQPVMMMAEFGDKAFLLLRVGGRLVGAAGWQVENLVSRTTEIVIDPQIPLDAGSACINS